MSRPRGRVARTSPGPDDMGLFPIDRRRLRVAGVDEAGRGPRAPPPRP